MVFFKLFRNKRQSIILAPPFISLNYGYLKGKKLKISSSLYQLPEVNGKV